MKINNLKILVPLSILIAISQSCTFIPKKITAITNFDSDKYLGKWYEIARFDFKYEKNLNNVTAQYSLNDNGTIKVLNSGYDYKKGSWKSSTGKAKFTKAKTIAELKVSFFGPFYAGYNVIALADDYKYALVAGGKMKYLWILSRTPTIPDEVKNDFVNKANSLGYDTSKLIWVEHSKVLPG